MDIFASIDWQYLYLLSEPLHRQQMQSWRQEHDKDRDTLH